MASLSLAMVYAALDRHNANQMARIAHETAAATSTTVAACTGATAGGDARKMRGIPVLASGIGGAINGTKPHVAALYTDR